MDELNERDSNGNLTNWALAADALSDHGCDCENYEDNTCLACLCEQALRTERKRAEKAELMANSYEAILRTLTPSVLNREIINRNI